MSRDWSDFREMCHEDYMSSVQDTELEARMEGHERFTNELTEGLLGHRLGCQMAQLMGLAPGSKDSETLIWYVASAVDGIVEGAVKDDKILASLILYDRDGRFPPPEAFRSVVEEVNQESELGAPLRLVKPQVDPAELDCLRQFSERRTPTCIEAGEPVEYQCGKCRFRVRHGQHLTKVD